MLSTLFTVAKKTNVYVNLSSKSSKKSPLINIVERSPTPILLPNAATLLKSSGEFFGVIDIARLSLYKSPALY